MNLIAQAPEWLFYVYVGLLLLAAGEDIWRMKISNYTVLALLVAALASAVLAGLELGLWQNFAILAVGLAIGTPLFAKQIMGGGDVKLTVATAFWFLWQDALLLLLAIAFSGVIVVIFAVVSRFIGWGRKDRGRMISYGIAVAMGGILMGAFERGLIAL